MASQTGAKGWEWQGQHQKSKWSTKQEDSEHRAGHQRSKPHFQLRSPPPPATSGLLSALALASTWGIKMFAEGLSCLYSIRYLEIPMFMLHITLKQSSILLFYISVTRRSLRIVIKNDIVSCAFKTSVRALQSSAYLLFLCLPKKLFREHSLFRVSGPSMCGLAPRVSYKDKAVAY